jgi:hypothetical protein
MVLNDSLSLSRLTLMTSHSSIHVTLLSLHKRCRTGSETVQLCINTINSPSCEASVMHRTQINYFWTYYTALFCRLSPLQSSKSLQTTNSNYQSLCKVYSCTSTNGIPQLLYNMTVHYSVYHGLSLVHYATHNTISYVQLIGIIKCIFPIRSPNQKIAFLSHATCML